MDLGKLLESTLLGLGYELVDFEAPRGGMVRVFIDHPQGIGVDDCVRVSNHLTHLLTVSNVDYQRLEVSSPGLDRPLKKEADFSRFYGHTARLKLKVPLNGQRVFVGQLGELNNGILQLEIDGEKLAINIADLDKARLVPSFS